MSNDQTQADFIVGLWPNGRHGMAESLRYPAEKVRYWQRKGEIPQEEWPYILQCAARDRVNVVATDFIRHLVRPVESAEADSVRTDSAPV